LKSFSKISDIVFLKIVFILTVALSIGYILNVPGYAFGQAAIAKTYSSRLQERLDRIKEMKGASFNALPAVRGNSETAAVAKPLNGGIPAAASIRAACPVGAQKLPNGTVENILNVIESGEKYSVIIDPGHGGKPENGGKNSGDHWDPFSNTFLLPYNFGASCAGVKEHEWTLQTAGKVRQLLSLTATDEGFARFLAIIRKYIKAPVATVKKIRVDCGLTREYSFNSDPEAADPNINRKYRLFDSPEPLAVSLAGLHSAALPGGAAAANTGISAGTVLSSGRMAIGRISYINQKSPDLVVCIHNNSNPSRSARGMSAVIVPHFSFFSNINNASLENSGDRKKARRNINNIQVQGIVTNTYKKLANINIKTIISDTATYFTGFRAFTNKFIGLRYIMVTWRYNTSSLLSSFVFFFMRENSIFEYYKRAAGPEGYGGDNFYCSQELIRYVRRALWNDIRSDSAFAGKARFCDPDEIIGKHGDPFVSDWAIPLYVNAITAYVELGYLSNPKDRKMLVDKQDVIAEAMAVGIYSLLAGIQAGPDDGIEAPKGKPVDFSRYGRTGTSKGYFNISRDPLSF